MCIFYYRHPPPRDTDKARGCQGIALLRTRPWVLCHRTSHHCESQSKEVIYGDHFLADRSPRCIRVWLNFQGWCRVTAGPVREGRRTKKHWFLSEPNQREGFSSLLLQLLELSRELESAPLLNWENLVLLKGQLQPLKS